MFLSVGFNNSYNFAEDNVSSMAAFAQFNAQPIEKLKLVAGVRFEQTNDYQVNSIMNIPVPVALNDSTAILQNVPFEVDYGKINQGGLQIIPRFAAIYSINDKHVVKAMYGQSKKRSAFAESVNLATLQQDTLALADMSTIEINYLATISSKLGINLSLFRNDLSNLITRDITLTPQGNVIIKSNAAGEMQTNGIELTLKYLPIKKLHLEFSGTYQNSENLSEDTKDIDLAYAPKFLGYFKAYYSINNKMTVGLKARYVDTMLAEWNGFSRFSSDAPSYTVMDLNFRYNNIWKGLYFSGTVSNVLDQEIRYAAYQNAAWANQGVVGFGRRFFATVGYEF